MRQVTWGGPLCAAALLAGSGPAARGAGEEVARNVCDGGGGQSSSAAYVTHGSIGQPIVHAVGGGNTTEANGRFVHAGFFAPSYPPVARLSGPATVTAGQQASFDGSASSDIDCSTLAFWWNFGDGSTPGKGAATVAHAFAAAGSYTVALTVWDLDGNSHSAELAVDVRPAPDDDELTVLGGGCRAGEGNASALVCLLLAAMMCVRVARAGQ